MKVLLHYDSGFPTALLNHPELADTLRVLGEPKIIDRQAFTTHLEWSPIYPGVPVPVYKLREQWPNESPRRKIVRVSLDKGGK